MAVLKFPEDGSCHNSSMAHKVSSHQDFSHFFPCSKGQDSSVGIATRYRLDGPGIKSRWERDFPHPSRLALGPTQSPLQWVPGLSRE